MATPYLHKPIHLLILLPLLILTNSTEAQITDSSKNPNPQPPQFHPTMAIIIAIIISVSVLVGLYCYSRSFRDIAPNHANSISGRKKSGIDPAVLRSLPVMLYSDVKDHRIGTSSLECAVCINEFEDGDSIRLLPDCSHVFHEECIDAWLASHITCPVCRAVLEKVKEEAAEERIETAEAAVVVVLEEKEEEEVRRKEMKELERIRSRSRRAGGGRKKMELTRSHTTGHIAGEDLERYTLRLPEAVRNDIFVAGRLRRERSLPAGRGVNKRSEGDLGSSSRRGLMPSAKWPSFFLRSLSVSSFSVRGSRLPENSSAKPDLPV